MSEFDNTNNEPEIDSIPPGLAHLRLAKTAHKIAGFKISGDTVMTKATSSTLDLDDDTQEGNTGDNTRNQTPERENWKKRYSDLKSYLDKKVNSVEGQLSEKDKEIARLADENKKLSAQSKLPTDISTPEELELLRKNNPALFKAIDTISYKRSNDVATAVAEVEKKYQEKLDRISKDNARTYLMAIHPDAEEISEDANFQAWYAKQPNGIKQLFNSASVEDIAEGLTIYKERTKQSKDSKPKDNLKLNASKLVSTSTSVQQPQSTVEKPFFKESDIQKIPDRDFPKYEKEILEAQRDGRILIGQ